MKITPKWSSKRTTYEQKGRTYVPEIIYREMWLVEKTGVEILVEITRRTLSACSRYRRLHERSFGNWNSADTAHISKH